MEIEDHHKEFMKITEKYHLKDDDKSEEIAKFLTTHKNGIVSANEFAKLFAMTEKEAEIFLTFIEKGLKFKNAHIKLK